MYRYPGLFSSFTPTISLEQITLSISQAPAVLKPYLSQILIEFCKQGADPNKLLTFLATFDNADIFPYIFAAFTYSTPLLSTNLVLSISQLKQLSSRCDELNWANPLFKSLSHLQTLLFLKTFTKMCSSDVASQLNLSNEFFDKAVENLVLNDEFNPLRFLAERFEASLTLT